ncbi:MAG: hypothetical protein V4495_00300 [Pseudomonadota bacterium]
MAIFENFIEMKLQNASLLEIALSIDDYGHNDFQELILRIGTYVTACIQSLHAIPDILAHTLYFALALNKESQPLKDRQISYSAVVDK